MKKLLSLVLSLALACGALVGLTACGGDKVVPYEGIKKVAYADMKVGLICLHDENSTYDKNFIEAFKLACKNKGIKEENVLIKTGIPEKSQCYDAAAELADLGCSLVFADSFGHESFMLKAAKEFPDTQFCHATGTTAHTEKRGNFHNAFASIYEGRFLAGVAAGEKIKEMVAADPAKVTTEGSEKFVKIGYVGAFTYAEVISGYTSYYLGVKYALNGQEYGVKMDVQFTGSWYDQTLESEAAATLINNGAILVSQHADSMGAPNKCEDKKIPNVSYNGSTEADCPNTFIVSSRINWAPYYEYVMDCINNGVEIDLDWSEGIGSTLADGSVCLTDLGKLAPAAGTADAIAAVQAKLKDGSLKVFDLSTFTVEGKQLEDNFMADVDTDENYTPDTVVIKEANGIKYFAESEFRSAPYFNVQIDGINLLNTKYGD